MCRPVTCKKCGKTTWAGCGQHVDQVMCGVAKTDRCQAHEDGPSTGFFARLLGRSQAQGRFIRRRPIP
jgi:hypothetical protein